MSKIILGDCLEVMKTLPGNSVDLVLTDPPYGVSASDWDKNINLDEFWAEILRVSKPTTPIIIFAQQPFTSLLIASNLAHYKYNWTWEKDNGTNFLSVKYQPFRVIEDICVFGKLGTTFNKKGNLSYYPQFTEGKAYKQTSGQQKGNSAIVRGGRGRGSRGTVGGNITESDGRRYPKNILRFNRDKEKLHPTQKPLNLIEYLVQTYSKENDVVLDPYLGSGTTARACKNLGREYIGIELNAEYVKVAEDRLKQEVLL